MAVRPPSKTPATTPPGGSGGVLDSSPALVPHGAHAGKPALPLHRPLILVGSRQRAHVHLISNSVSRVHAVIINTDHGSYLRDLASRVGTIVNGRQIKEAGLRHSDTITVGSFQFKFSAPTSRGPLAAATRAPASVLYVQNRPSVTVDGRTVLIGQRDTCDIALPSPLVSTAHALVFELNGRHFVRDLGSRTGTFVNGQPVHQEALEVGDMIRIGETAIRYAAAATADAADRLEQEPEEDLSVAEAAMSGPIPVTSVVPADAPHTEVFDDLAFAADVVGAPADEPIGGDAIPMDAPAEPEPSVTTHPDLDADAMSPAGEAYTAAREGRAVNSFDAIATAEDVFGPDEPLPLADAAGPTRFAEGPTLPPGDSDPAADAESLVPLPLADDVDALNPDLDFPPDSDSVAAALDEPFGPLTDLSLDLPDARDEAPQTPARPPLIDTVESTPEAAGAELLPVVMDATDAVVESAALPTASFNSGMEADTPSSISPEPETAPDLEPAADAEVEAAAQNPSLDLATIEPDALAPDLSATIPVGVEWDTPPEDFAPAPAASPVDTTEAAEASATIPPEAISPGPLAGTGAAAEETSGPHVPIESAALAPPGAAPVVIPTDQPPRAAKQRGGRKPAAQKSVDADDAQSTEPKKRRSWGRKAKEIAEAEAAAAAATIAAGVAALTRPEPEDAAGLEVVPPVSSADSDAPANDLPASSAEMIEADAAPADARVAADVAPPALSESADASSSASLPAADMPPSETQKLAPPETLASTEPSPESALDFSLSDTDTFLAGGGLADDVSVTSADAPFDDAPFEPAPFEPAPFESAPFESARSDASPSDPAFDAMVEEFMGSSTGPIVESPDDVSTETPGASIDDGVWGGQPVATEPSPAESTLPAPAPDLSFGRPSSELSADSAVVPTAAATASIPLSSAGAGVGGPDLAGERLGLNELNDAIARAPEAPAPGPAFDPFLGMGRDAGSFIGGMPLDFLTPDPVPINAPPAQQRLGDSTESDSEPGAPRFEPGPDALDRPPSHPLVESDAFAEAMFDRSPADESAPPEAEARAGATFGTLDGAELDLALSELALPDPPETASGAVSASAADDLLDADALDLPDLPAPPAAPAKGRLDDEVDPLMFTEAESPTLQFLPKPAAPPARPAGGAPGGPSQRREARHEPHRGPQRPTAKGGGGAAPAGPPPASRGAPPSKYPATPPPPARSSTPRRAVTRAPFDLDATIPGPGVGVPPGSLSGGLPGGGAAHAFDGLAVPPVRQTDVFSGLPLGANDPVLGGSRPGTPRKAAQRSGEIPPGVPAGGAMRPGADFLASPEDLAPFEPLAPLPPLARPRRGGRPGPAAPLGADTVAPHAGHVPIHDAARHGGSAPGQGWADGGFQPPPRRHIGIGAWLAMMILTLGATSAGILFFAPRPGAEVIGTLQFDRLRELPELQRREFEKDQRDWLGRPDFRGQAREILLVSHAGLAPGFLGNDDQAVIEYEKIVSGMHVKERSGSLTLPHRGNDPDGDRARMEALLKALGAVNKPRRDQAARARSQFESEQKKLNDLTADLEGAKRRAAALRDKAESVPDLEAKLRGAQAEDQTLRAAVAQARREVDRLRGELGRAQSVIPPSSGRYGRRGKFSPAFTADFAALAVASMLVLPPASAAEALPATAPAANGRRRAGANDPVLRRMEQQLALKERHRNAALGGGLTRDAARLDGEIAELGARLAIVRELVGAGLPDEQTAGLKQRIDDRANAAARDRADGRADAAPAGPVAGRADAREALEREGAELRTKIDVRRGELVAAREAAAREAAAREAAAREAVAREAADVSAPAPAAVTEPVAMAQVPAQDPVNVVEPDPAAEPPAGDEAPPAPADAPPSAEKLKADLAAAERREADAVAAAARGGDAVLQARSALDEAKRAETDLAATIRDQQGAVARHGKQLAAVEALRNELASIVVPVEPGPDAIAVNPVGDDRRYLYMLIAGACVVIAFSLLMWLSSHGSQSLAFPDRDNPFEAPVIGAPVVEGSDPNADDERPLVV